MSEPASATLRSLDASSGIPLIGIALYVVTSIFYVLPPGLPQPADFVLFLTICATFSLSWRHLPDEPLLYLTVVLFAGWIVLVNGIWFVLLQDYRFLQNTLFYIFNFTVMVFVVGIALRDFERLCAVLWWGCIAALVIEAIYLQFFYVATERRSAGTFNNPNQLGYWVLLVFCCLGVVRRRRPVGWIDVLAIALGWFAVALSLSRAATIASSMVVLAMVAVRGVRRGVGSLLIGLVLVGTVYEFLSGGIVQRIMDTQIVAALDHRISGIAQVEQDDDMVKRGYGRLVDSAQHLALGAGEGAYQRLSKEGYDKEFHSTLGNVVLSYGVVGLTLFGFLLFVVLKATPWCNWIYLLAIMVYGITHMGLRDSLFWVLLAIMFAQGRLAERGGANPATVRSQDRTESSPGEFGEFGEAAKRW